MEITHDGVVTLWTFLLSITAVALLFILGLLAEITTKLNRIRRELHGINELMPLADVHHGSRKTA